MYIQNLNDKKFKIIPAHNGKGEIRMKFFHQEFQKFRGVDDLPKPHTTQSKTNWNFIAYAELPVGSTIGKHFHEDNDEIYIIIEGEATMKINNQIKKIEKGDVILTRAGSTHEVNNVKKELIFYAFEVVQNG